MVLPPGWRRVCQVMVRRGACSKIPRMRLPSRAPTGRGGDDDPALFVGKEVSGSLAGAAVELVADGVGEDLEERVQGGMGVEGQSFD